VSQRIGGCSDDIAEQHKEAGMRELLRRMTRKERRRGHNDNN
jgi:hypothetical protein